jgi:hypothetical protein
MTHPMTNMSDAESVEEMQDWNLTLHGKLIGTILIALRTTMIETNDFEKPLAMWTNNDIRLYLKKLGGVKWDAQ